MLYRLQLLLHNCPNDQIHRRYQLIDIDLFEENWLFLEEKGNLFT